MLCGNGAAPCASLPRGAVASQGGLQSRQWVPIGAQTQPHGGMRVEA